MTADLSLPLAFLAGLLSFLSPCVLPLIPSYLSILGGVGINNPAAEQRADRPRFLLAALGFSLGFSVVFVFVGIVITAAFNFMGGVMRQLTIAGGIVVIVLGLNIVFNFLSFLNYEKRPFFNHRIFRHAAVNSFPRVAAAFIAGAAFATGWTPCIGPILAGIFFMAGQSGNTAAAVMHLSVYSLGLALPFIAVALFFDTFLKRLPSLRRHMALIQRISGIVLIIIGISILSGHFSAFNILAQRMTLG